MLRDNQIDKLKNMLNPLNSAFWKVLILDQGTKKILAPVLRVNDLRDLGITSHFLIENQREKITEIPAIYFVQPTQENINRIKNDVLAGLYHGFYLNFTSRITREDLEGLAQQLSYQKVAFHIISIFDQFIDFVSHQSDLFSISHIKNINISVCDHLFSVFYCLNKIPFIIAPSKEYEVLAKKLTNKIKSVKLIQNTNKRPLLVILNRNFDIQTPIEHVWSYNAIIHDLLGINLNKVEFDGKSFDILDEFYIKNQHEPFPVVAEKIEQELLSYKKEMTTHNIGNLEDKNKIDEVLEKLPELSRKNDIIQTHMAICLKIVEIVKERNIDEFYRLERKKISKEEYLSISDKGNDYDITRFCACIKEKDVAKAMLMKRKLDLTILDSIANQNINVNDENGGYKKYATQFLGNVKKMLYKKSLIVDEIEKVINAVKSQNLSNYIFYDVNEQQTIYEKEIDSIVVYIDGCGTYEEYNALQEFSIKSGYKIYYGCRELVRGEDYVKMIVNNKIQM